MSVRRATRPTQFLVFSYEFLVVVAPFGAVL